MIRLGLGLTGGRAFSGDVTDLTTVVALLVTTVGSTGTLLGAVTLGVSLVATVVALHRGSLNTVVGAVVGPVAGLLAVVADLRPTSGVAPLGLGRARSGHVTESTAVVAVATTGSGSSTSLRAVTGDVTGLSALVTSTTVGRGSLAGGSTGGAERGDVAGLTTGVTGLGGLRVGARVGDVAGLSTLVTGRGTGGGAGSGLVGGVPTVVTSTRSVHL